MKNARPQTAGTSAQSKCDSTALLDTLLNFAVHAVWISANVAAALLILGGCNG